MPRAVTAVSSAAAITVDAVYTKQIANIRNKVTKFAETFAIVRRDSKNIAPIVMGIFEKMRAAYGNALSFVAFTRLFDDTIPMESGGDSGGYKGHATYNAMVYLRQVYNMKPRGKAGEKDPAKDKIGRALATVLQVIADESLPTFWEGVRQAFDLGPKQLTTLQRNVKNTKPLIDLHTMRKLAVSPDRVIKMTPRPKETAAEAAGHAVSGRKLKRQLQASLRHVKGGGKLAATA